MIVRQVRTVITILLQFSLSTLQYVNLCVDTITKAIYQAYENKADISECVCFMLFLEQSVSKREKSLKNCCWVYTSSVFEVLFHSIILFDLYT